MTNEIPQSPLDRVVDAARDEALRRLLITPSSVMRDLEALKARRLELNSQKFRLATAAASRDEEAARRYTQILGELANLDNEEDILNTALAGLRAEERRARLRADAARIDEHRRRAGRLVGEIIESASEAERTFIHLFNVLSKLREAEGLLRSELRDGQVNGASFVSVYAYVSDRLNVLISGRLNSTLDVPADKRAETFLSRFVDLPSVLDGDNA